MNLEQVRDTVDHFTAKVSDNIRTVAFAGLAVVWTLKSTDQASGKTILPSCGAWALVLFAIALVADLLQYRLAAGAYLKVRDAADDADKNDADEIVLPEEINTWPTRFYNLKFWSTVFGYTLLAWVVVHTIK